MKNIYAFIISFITAVTFAQAKGDLELGFGIGTSGSTVNYENNEFDAQTANSVNFSASADYNFANRWSVKTKVIYDQKGWDDGTLFFRRGMLRNADVDLHYLTVPVMLNWHFGGKRNWYLNFGTYAGFLMEAGEENFDADVKEAFRDTDFGITFGIGAKIPVSKFVKLYIEYDFQTSFNSIYKDSTVPQVYSVRNALNVGVNFLVL